MNAPVSINVPVNLSPAEVAVSFWNLGSDGQAEFFAELERIAGVSLCFQMAYVVCEIADRADRGDRDAMHGFQTMLAHAVSYGEGSTLHRGTTARIDLDRFVASCRSDVFSNALDARGEG